jgi:hypothetical protein
MEIDVSLGVLRKSVEKYKKARDEEKSKNIIPRNSVERMAEKKLMKISKSLMQRADSASSKLTAKSSSVSESSIGNKAIVPIVAAHNPHVAALINNDSDMSGSSS